MTPRRLLVAGLLRGLLLAACTSPEATRMRADGAGADVKPLTRLEAPRASRQQR